MTKIFVFPGQGSQKIGMGEGLFEKYSNYIDEADNLLGYSVKNLCLNDPDNVLSQTQYTQPALYIVNSLMYLDKIQEGENADYVAGHSLGEYNALFAADAFDFITGLKLVQKRGEVMSKVRGGGMAAVIGMTKEQIESVLKNNGFDNIDIANYNSPTQIVISGLGDEIINAQSAFEEAGTRMYIPLKVSGAFHSRYMQEPASEFKDFIQDFSFSAPKIPVISNYQAKPYQENDIIDNLVRQICNPVQWTDSIKYLLNQPDPDFEEVGPGKVLTGLVRQIQSA